MRGQANHPEAVVAKLKTLPTTPGCYIYKDADDHVLYVGKAVNLRNRVRSYFRASANHGLRIARLVSKIADIQWIVVDGELEALVLECSLIKKYRPPYNIRLRDDKNYPYIAITREPFPRVIFTRNRRKDGTRYFGPYSSAFAVRDTLRLLHKVFPLIPCGKSWTGERVQRPCLYYDMGRCLAPCAGVADREAYGKVLATVERFLMGREDGLVADLTAEMESAAGALDFELAARRRDQIRALEEVQQHQKVLVDEAVDQDVIAIVQDERGAAIQMLYVRGGKLIGQRQFLMEGTKESNPSDVVQEFVKQYYSEQGEPPKEILLPVEIEERNIVQHWLRGRRGGAVTIRVPRGGEGLKLVDMAASNAEAALKTAIQDMEASESLAAHAIEEVQEALDLTAPPLRIECYDISNIQGKAPVGSMVVAINGEPAKSEYRRFKVRYHPESPDDFAMMHEVLTRRLKALREGDEKFNDAPDLIVIDGGKGQLSAALQARDEQGLQLPMVGLAKRMELIYIPDAIGGLDVVPVAERQEYEFRRGAGREYAFREVELGLQSAGLTMVRRLRDEAHRFAITFHRKLRDKGFQSSRLEEIPGVGPRRRRLLLRTFGSIEGIRRAAVEDIAAVPTMTERLAAEVKSYLNEE